MQCPCGQETVSQTHEVKTIEKAREWYSLIKPEQLPIRVEQEKCNACGRMKRSIYDDNQIQGVLIYTKG